MKPKMTPAEAREFGTQSLKNAAMVLLELKSKDVPCNCLPYRDVFTYRRWKAQGKQVQRGERCMRVPVIKLGSKEALNEKNETVKKYFRIRGTAFLFCRCQVKSK